MSEKINWSLNVQVAGGPSISKSGIMDVDAYDKFEIVVPKATGNLAADAGKVTVDVQPGIASNMRFVLITSDNYESLKCEVDPNPANPGKVIALDGPLIIMGTSVASLLGSSMAKLKFENGSQNNTASISILIGRKATA